jgi:hypothetical protein
MELLGDVGKWNLISVHSRTVLVSEQDRCTVRAKHTIGSEIVLYALNGSPRRCGSSADGSPRICVSSGSSFGDSANLDARYDTVCA